MGEGVVGGVSGVRQELVLGRHERVLEAIHLLQGAAAVASTNHTPSPVQSTTSSPTSVIARRPAMGYQLTSVAARARSMSSTRNSPASSPTARPLKTRMDSMRARCVG
jgi:hypothetical protein